MSSCATPHSLSQPFHMPRIQPLPRLAVPSTLPAIRLIHPTHHSPSSLMRPDLPSLCPLPSPAPACISSSSLSLQPSRHRTSSRPSIHAICSALHITSSSCRHAYPVPLPVSLIPSEALVPCHPLNTGCPQSRFSDGSPCPLLTVSASGRSSACLASRTLRCFRASPCAAIPLPPC